jgi:hypothetical protein
MERLPMVTYYEIGSWMERLPMVTYYEIESWIERLLTVTYHGIGLWMERLPTVICHDCMSAWMERNQTRLQMEGLPSVTYHQEAIDRLPKYDCLLLQIQIQMAYQRCLHQSHG